MKSLMLSTTFHLYGCVVYLNMIHSSNVYYARLIHITYGQGRESNQYKRVILTVISVRDRNTNTSE